MEDWFGKPIEPDAATLWERLGELWVMVGVILLALFFAALLRTSPTDSIETSTEAAAAEPPQQAHVVGEN